VLPIATLSLVPFAYSFMLIRNALKTVNQQPFIQIKQAYGIAGWRILAKHALKNALIPLISIMAPLTAALVTGSFAVELIFAIPGLGKHFIYAVSNRDYTLVMGITLVYSVVLIGLNFVTDVLYGVVNPKMKAS
jgi:oligopeptide transport system permease protein